MNEKIMLNRLDEFYERVGAIELYHHLPWEPVMPPFFSNDEIERLAKFVRANPAYHIITVAQRANIVYNRFLDNGAAWMLADGDTDPELTSVTTPRKLQEDL